MYFRYGDKETEYLKKKDKVLGEVIEKIGHVNYVNQKTSEGRRK